MLKERKKVLSLRLAAFLGASLHLRLNLKNLVKFFKLN